jgi:hypothetical protein
MDMKEIKMETNEKITSGFKTPEGYWDDFSEKVMQQLPNNEPKIISFYSSRKKWMYSTAAILVIALSLPIINHLQNKEEELSSSEIENYLTMNKSVSDDEIVNLLEQEDIDNLKISTPITKEAIEDELSNNTELEQYITNEN